MVSNEIQQMQQALIRQGLPEIIVRTMPDVRIRELCNEKLQQSLTGNRNFDINDTFSRQFSYDKFYTTREGERINVALVTTQRLQSGITVEIFVDRAGKQYFSYKDSNGRTVNENNFRRQARIEQNQQLRYMNGKLYKANSTGTPVSVLESSGEVPAMIASPTRYHPKYRDLQISPRGKIDIEQFTIENLKKRYSPNRYNFTTENVDGQQRVTITDKATGRKVCSCTRNNNGEINFLISNGDKSTRYDINTQGTVVGYGTEEKNKGFISYRFEDDGVTLSQMRESDGRGHYRIKGFKNGILETLNEIEYDVRTNREKSNTMTTYKNGYPLTRTVIGTPGEEYLTAKTLHQEFNNSGNSINIQKIKNILNTRDIRENDDLLREYKEKYGTSLIEDMMKLHTDDASIEQLLSRFDITHSKELFFEVLRGASVSGRENYANRLLSKINKGNIMDYLAFIQDKDYEALSSNRNIYNLFTSHLRNVFNSMSDFGMGYIRDDANEFINELEQPNPDKNKISRLYLRLKQRVTNGRNEHSFFADNFVFPNGKIDENFRQGHTNDCWLLSGIISAAHNQKALAKLNDCISVNTSTQDVTVTLKGVGKTFVITREKLVQTSQYFSRGEDDARAIEIAVDEYMKEYDPEHYDINGNNATYLWALIFGADKVQEHVSKEDFIQNINNENRIFALGLNRNFDESKLIIEKMDGTRVRTFSQHEYSIIGADSRYVYLINPHDSSERLRSPRDNFLASVFEDDTCNIHGCDVS
ncbi:MAG: hypothetical protein K6E29_03075 [Cyanobacteria bacterium RUI128]|nr:hypothetical protein [Cyanobacteria bacterium RUI128]